ncbi:MAG TPA: hypothetical protein VN515_07180 [Terriglobales bacterium]|nr:hypothetical protein [Terriglobales bacterium]
MASRATPAHTSITIRGLDPALKQRLRERAARHGRSLEAEAREILKDSITAPSESAYDKLMRIRQRFGPLEGGDFEPPSRKELWKNRELPRFDF